MTTIKGSPNATPQSTRFEWIDGQGWTTLLSWRGPKPAILGILPQIEGYERGSVGGVEGSIWEAQAFAGFLDDGSEEVPVDTWELIGEDVTRDVRENEYFAGLTQSQLQIVEEAVRENTIGPADPIAQELYDLLIRGTSSFRDSHYVLQHTQTTSRNSTAAISVTNVNRLWTTAQVTGAYNSIPSTIVAAINNIPTPNTGVGYLWRWLKAPPLVSKTLLGKTEIVERWSLASWSTKLYSLA